VSLRARLLLATLLVATLGLVIADIATFRLLRSTLTERVDEQLTVATPIAIGILSTSDPFGQPDGGRGGQELGLFPAGTYAAVLDEDGDVVRSHVFGFEQDVPPPPEIPDGLPGSTGGAETSPQTFTARAEDGSTRYRGRAYALVEGGTLVVAIPLTDVADTLRQLVRIELVVTIVVLAILGALAWWLVRLGLRPLERMEATADAIAGGDLSRRVEPADAKTEVGRLGLALNAMLERIEGAFAERRASEERLRRFVADASHELRTPLTSVQGYAELFRRGAADDPEALGNAMRRIEDESARMSELVDEMSLLARLDQRRPLERGSVDIAAVATAAVDAARVAEPQRPVEIDAPTPVVVQGDAARLRQVADNLLANARTHTPAGTPVHVRVRAEGREAVLEVEDEGPGIPPEDAERVFERFYRADPSRSRESGGAGLGLSIVAAVAEAHGGSVRYEPAPGGGARFRVRLPIGDLLPPPP
jgi:two-component system OmpR family sensor kinase